MQACRAVACAVGVLVAGAAVAREGSHALIIGVENYSAASGATPLLGVPHDVANARKMAAALGVSPGSIVEIRDGAATKARISQALADLDRKVQAGDRVLVYFSGHGTRQTTPNGCEEGFSTYTGEMITEVELAAITEPISRRADKLLVVLDSCFSGGVIGSQNTRALLPSGMRAKFTPGLTECAAPVNHPVTRSLLSEYKRLGVHDENFVQISSANHNEVSWDNEDFGGIATRSLTECIVSDATDLNRNGAVSLEEVRACTQKKMDALMAPYRSQGMIASTLQVRGNRNLIVAPATPAAVPAAEPSPPATVAVTEQPTPAPAPAISTLEELLQQRDPRLKVDVTIPSKLKIGKDPLRFTVKSSFDGYLYVIMLGSDARSYYMLFPNALDKSNQVRANQRRDFPSQSWQVTAGGPVGTDRLLFVVTKSPRDLSVFAGGAAASGGGAFTYALADEKARRQLVDLLVGSGVSGRNASMGAAMAELAEIEQAGK